MTLGTVSREIKSYPATAIFSLAWVVVFAAMLCVRMREEPAPPWLGLFIMGIGDGHRFGDLTLRDFWHGELWRLITCTFVHYSVIHVALNLLAFYLLGTLIESWYGTSQLVLIYALTGGLGNLISVFIRHSLGSGTLVHSGGGSVVIMGLIGLCAVAGWRSRTETGSDLGWQMTKALGLTALLGVAFPRYIDNWGHAGGALVGLLLGLFHPRFMRQHSRPRAWAMGIPAGFLILGCLLAQARADRREAPHRRESMLKRELDWHENAYRNLRASLALLNQQKDPRMLAPALDAIAGVLDRGATRADFRRLRQIAALGAGRELTPEESDEFKHRALALATHVRGELDTLLREYWKERRRPSNTRTGGG
ncbi:MAG: rhomboid family intramembrane serine protease [Isosphaeraceae bacterium]